MTRATSWEPRWSAIARGSAEAAAGGVPPRWNWRLSPTSDTDRTLRGAVRGREGVGTREPVGRIVGLGRRAAQARRDVVDAVGPRGGAAPSDLDRRTEQHGVVARQLEVVDGVGGEVRGGKEQALAPGRHVGRVALDDLDLREEVRHVVEV